MILAPAPLTRGHDIASFHSGEPVLDDWLKRRALSNQISGASRTYVVAKDNRVLGYYSLAAGAVLSSLAPGRVRRNMPNSIPVMILARLAVDQTVQDRGFGIGLLQDAILRTLQAAEITGIRALLVHALHEKAAAFYFRFGFQPSPLQPLTYMLLLHDARLNLSPSAP